MLTRATLRRQRPTFLIRLLSDKCDNNNATLENEKIKKPSNDETVTSKSASSTQKIQDLLKSMVEANKIKEQENKVPIITAPGIYKRKPHSNVIEEKQEKIEEKVTAAVSEVAKTLGGDTKKTEAELLSRVLGEITQSPTSLSELVSGMKIDRTKDDRFQQESRGQQVRRFVESSRTMPARPPMRRQAGYTQREPTRDLKPTVVNIFSEKPLGILKATDTPNYGPRLETWEKLSQRELKLCTTQPPRNYFEKMAMWTEQGKVWKFPIDNEQGLEEEAKVHFSEHVFVESHLEGWCPDKGPIRHFMELVCVGLSKNPFYTVQEKKDHILWFRDYFESKKNILEGLEVVKDNKPTSEKTTNV